MEHWVTDSMWSPQVTKLVMIIINNAFNNAEQNSFLTLCLYISICSYVALNLHMRHTYTCEICRKLSCEVINRTNRLSKFAYRAVQVDSEPTKIMSIRTAILRHYHLCLTIVDIKIIRFWCHHNNNKLLVKQMIATVSERSNNAFQNTTFWSCSV